MRILSFLLTGIAAFGQDDNGPPKLKRGQPKPAEARAETASGQKPIREVVTDADGNVVSESSPTANPGPVSASPGVTIAQPSTGAVPEVPPAPVSTPVLDTIAEARRISSDLGEKIPNFICDQITFRHQGEGWPKPTWKLKDRVTTELTYNEGAETYRNTKIGGKIFGIGSKRPPEQTGNWSTGDWMSIIQDVMQPSSDAEFKFDKDDELGGRKAWRYRYNVRQSNSHWKIQLEGGTYKPAYRGMVWIDKETYRVLRVEMEARQLPKDYPLSVIEMTSELAAVTIGGQSHLLPVRAQNLTCQRDSVTCHRNDLEFRNYHRFGAESSISTTDSSVTFDGEEDAAAAKPKSPAGPAGKAPKAKKPR